MSTTVARARYLVVLPVLGTAIAAVALHLFGLVRAAKLLVDAVGAFHVGDGGPGALEAKELIVDSIMLIDVFLVATAFLVIAAGMYELFLGELPLPEWLQFRDFDDLKARLAAVIVVGLLVAFLGEALRWPGGADILALGASIAAVILATGVVFGLPGREGVVPRWAPASSLRTGGVRSARDTVPAPRDARSRRTSPARRGRN